MSISTGSNITAPNTISWATSDDDPFDRTHLSNLAEDVDLHDHSSGKGLAVARLAATVTAESTDAGATGVTITTYHNSATPAANDIVFRLTMDGEDSAGNQTTYAQVYAQIASATDASEAATLVFKTMVAGSVTDALLLTGGAAGLANRIYGGGLQVDAGNVYVGDSANAQMTLGLTLNQGAADDEIVALKSSDVAHGMTTSTETDTYATLRKFSAASGGAAVRGFSAGTTGLFLAGNHVTGDTTKTTAAVACVQVRASLKTGTTVGANGANENLLAVQDATSTRFIVDAEGNFFSDDVGSTYDEYDDLALVETFDLRRDFAAWRDERRDQLVAAGILAPPDAAGNRGLTNWTNVIRLHNGAFRQLAARFGALERTIADQAAEIAGLKTQIALKGA